MKFTVSILFALMAAPVFAACSDTPIKHNWAFATGDQRVSGNYVKKTVSGKKVWYFQEFEHYRKDGSYIYADGTTNHKPDGYVFYSDGSRCLNYERPRYDMYVVRDSKLVLINMQGERVVGRTTR